MEYYSAIKRKQNDTCYHMDVQKHVERKKPETKDDDVISLSSLDLKVSLTALARKSV